MKNFKYFHLYQDCIIVKGSLNSLIIDHYKRKIFSLSTDIINTQFSDNQFILNTDENYDLISILLRDDFGYATNNTNAIQKQIVWESPRDINEIIIEDKCDDSYCLPEIYNQIEDIDAEFIQIRFLNIQKIE